jgi:sialate O-acetylesterase
LPFRARKITFALPVPIMRSFLSCGVAAVLLALTARADVTLGPLFVDHAVLQRDKPVAVWGRADPGETVTVSYLLHRGSAAAGRDGRWIVLLDAMAADAVGGDLVAAGKTTVTLHDVVVGEVWLASGQSNMEFVVDDPTGAVYHVDRAAEEVAAANYPLIRHFKVAHQVSALPSDEAGGSWQPCSPATVRQFSAVSYFFARDLFRRLNVPIGIINSSWGGTPVESWMSSLALAGDPRFAVVGQRWRQNLADYPRAQAEAGAALAVWNRDAAAARAKGPASFAQFGQTHPKPRPARGPGNSWTPMGLFNGMINPLLPYALRGAIWYQGESNTDRAAEYHGLFAAMITAWRAHFGQGDFPFYWVQLANYTPAGDFTHQTWAFLREAQSAALSLPNTGQAVTIDLGDPANLHPPNKQEVGRRLALLAKVNTYGIPGDCSGPVFVSASTEGPVLRLHFKFADAGLTAADKPLQSFEIAGADRQYHPATALIAGDTVVVHSPAVPAPVAVRYAWRNAPEANFYNGAGLPAAPFRSDRW